MFKVDDKVTIKRGKHRGGGTIVLEADPTGQIAVKSDAGFVFITNADNLKVPEEATVSVSAMARAFEEVAAEESDNRSTLNALDRLAGRIGNGLPTAIAWPSWDGQVG